MIMSHHAEVPAVNVLDHLSRDVAGGVNEHTPVNANHALDELGYETSVV